MARLGDLFELQMSGEWGDKCSNTEPGTYVIRTTNFTSSGNIDYTNVARRSIEQSKIERKRLRQGDIILEKSGGTDKTPVGRVVYCDELIEKDTYLCNNFTQAMRVDRAVAIPKYAFYSMWFLHFSGRTELLQNKTTGIRNLRVKDYLDLQIPLPPLDEQRKIAAVLDKVSQLIALRKQQAKMLDVLVQARFAEMFGDPVQNTKGWEVARLGEVCSFYAGTAFPNKYQGKTEGEFPFFKVGDISKNVIAGNIRLLQSDNYINSDVVRCIKGTIVPPDTVVFAKIGEGLKLNRRAITICNCLIDNNVIGVRANEGLLDTSYFYYFMCNIDMAIYSEVTVVPSVRKSRIENITIPLPPLALQQEFAAFAEKAQGVKTEVMRSTEQLETLKKALMQKFFFEEAQG